MVQTLKEQLLESFQRVLEREPGAESEAELGNVKAELARLEERRARPKRSRRNKR